MRLSPCCGHLHIGLLSLLASITFSGNPLCSEFDPTCDPSVDTQIILTTPTSNTCSNTPAVPDFHYACSAGIPVYTGVVIYPVGDIVWEVGLAHEVYCEVDPKQGISASDLSFTWDGSSIVQIELNNTFMRGTVTQSEGGRFGLACVTGECRCFRNVLVGYPPLDVQNLACISKNWESLKCQWDVPENPAQMNSEDYRVFLTFGNTTKHCDSFEGDNESRNESCTWTESYAASVRNITVQFVTENALGTGDFLHTFDNFEIVLPSPPENTSSVEETPLWIKVTWQTPSALVDFPPGLIYRVEYRGLYVQIPQTEVKLGRYSGSSQWEVEVEVLYPWVTYEFEVRLRSGVNNVTGGEESWDDGWWSRSAISTMATKAAAPEAAPMVGPGTFQAILEDPLTLTVMWAPLPRLLHYGPNLRYLVTCADLDNVVMENTTVEQPFVVFDTLQLGLSYRVTILAENDEGPSLETSEILIHGTLPPPPVLPVVVSHSSTGQYELRWEHTKNLSYTVYVCTGQFSDTCEDGLHWVSLGSVWAVNLTLEEMNITGDASNVRFALSAEDTDGVSSGLSWDECVTPFAYNTLRTPPTIDLLETKQDTANFKWDIKCVDRAGVVMQLESSLTRCEGHGRTGCNGEPVSKIENNTFSDTIFLEDLLPNSNYSVRLRVLYRSGFSAWSSPLMFITESQASPGLPVWLIAIIASGSIVVAVILAVGGRHVIRKGRVYWKTKSMKLFPPGMEEPEAPENDETTKSSKSIATILRDLQNNPDDIVIFDDSHKNISEIGNTLGGKPTKKREGNSKMDIKSESESVHTASRGYVLAHDPFLSQGSSSSSSQHVGETLSLSDSGGMEPLLVIRRDTEISL